MVCELEVYIGTQKHRAFLQRGFYASSEPTTHFHSHYYAEVHLVSGGRTCFQVGERIYEVQNGDALVVPCGLFHCCISKEDSVIHTAFQIDCEAACCSICALPQGMAAAFLEEVRALEFSENYTKVSAYISLVASFLEHSVSVPSRKISDYGFLIHEFLSIYYKENICLGDLASVLHLSERQTERLMLEHTGKTFRQALVNTRVTIARQLMRVSSMSLAEIARYVGYESYAGFWKAMKKYGENDEKQD